MKTLRIPAAIVALSSLALSACQMHAEGKDEGHGHGEHKAEQQKIIVTTPLLKEVTITQQYVCQIRSQKSTDLKAMQEGYLEPITVKEGQAVKAGDILFAVNPVLYKARLDAEVAEARLAELELLNTKRLRLQNVVSDQEVALFEAKLARAQAKAAQAQAEFNFTSVRAPFDGIIDRLLQQQGSLVKKDDLLTSLSDNSVMWVYFNVPEARYLEYKKAQGNNQANAQRLELVDSRVELVLADGSSFKYSAGNSVTVEGKFNYETGNIPFRADFPNPDRLLRHGQTGNILIHRTVRNAIVIPQRATFEVLDKQYVYVVGEDHVVHQRPITILHEHDDIYVIKSGVAVNEKIVLEGIRQVHEGSDLRDFEFRKPEDALTNQKNHAE